MKLSGTLIVSVLVGFSGLAQAHPTNDLSYLQVGRGAKLIVRQSINIAPKTNMKQFQFGGSIRNFCNLSLVTGSRAWHINQELGQDVELGAGTELTVVGTGQLDLNTTGESSEAPFASTLASGEIVYLKLMTSKGTPLELECIANNNGNYGDENDRTQMSIGTMRGIIAPYLQIQFATPVQL